MEAMVRPSNPAWLNPTASTKTQVEDVDENRWESLFAAVADGWVDALGELYDLAATDVYRLALWRTGSSEDAEDVVQDVFVRVAENRPRLVSVRHPKRWLLTVTRRIAIDLCRKRNRRDADSLDQIPYLEALSEDPAGAVDAQAVSKLVGQLPAKQREVLLLRHFADCTFADIGRITGVPTFTAASRHRLAVAKLRRLLEKNHEPTA
jgi:RNA polymerase sigma-70 factor (ECF subfamily)